MQDKTQYPQWQSYLTRYEHDGWRRFMVRFAPSPCFAEQSAKEVLAKDYPHAVWVSTEPCADPSEHCPTRETLEREGYFTRPTWREPFTDFAEAAAVLIDCEKSGRFVGLRIVRQGGKYNVIETMTGGR